MKLPLFPYLPATVVVVLLAVYASHLQRAQADDSVAMADSTHTAPNQLRYPPNAPQLAYLNIEAVRAMVPPVIEPLPARITFDEDHAARVFSPVAGRVVQILVQTGQRVRAGEILAWLLAPDYDTAVADLRKAQADHDNKQAAQIRAQHLHDAGVIATRDLEAAVADARGAQAELARAAARLRGLDGVGKDGRLPLRAPIEGVIAERHLNPGQEMRPDATDPAFVIIDPSHLDVVADVAETEVGKLHVGQHIRLQADGVDLSSLTGQINTVGIAMDAATRRIPIRAHLQGTSANVRPEMFVRLAPLDAGAPAAVAVPNSAIVTSGEKSFVFVERSPGLLVKTQVSLLLRGRDQSYVREGLSAGARVVTKGAILLDAELASDN